LCGLQQTLSAGGLVKVTGWDMLREGLCMEVACETARGTTRTPLLRFPEFLYGREPSSRERQRGCVYTVSWAEFIPHSFNSHACWLKLEWAAVVGRTTSWLTERAIEWEFCTIPSAVGCDCGNRLFQTLLVVKEDSSRVKPTLEGSYRQPVFFKNNGALGLTYT
jgi:hypothetical protein